jgi:serine protease Do
VPNYTCSRPRLHLGALFTIAFVIFSASLIEAKTSAGAEPSPETIAKFKRAVVIVTTFDIQDKPLLQGSGFFVKNTVVVTNMHVIKGAAHVRITTVDGKTCNVQSVVTADECDDLALLQVEGSAANEVLQLADTSALEGQAVTLVSSPQGSPWKVTRGHLGLLWAFGGSSSRIQISASILPGSSGGPVINEQGRVIAIAAMHIPSAEELNFAVPVECLKAFLQASPTLASNHPSLRD